MSLQLLLMHKNLTLTELMKKGVLIIEPIRLFGKKDGQFIMYQTIGISLVHKNKHQTNLKYQEQRYLSKNRFDLLVPENILSFRRRRKLRILICFNSKNRNGMGTLKVVKEVAGEEIELVKVCGTVEIGRASCRERV